jgi:hypothetical protein
MDGRYWGTIADRWLLVPTRVLSTKAGSILVLCGIRSTATGRRVGTGSFDEAARAVAHALGCNPAPAVSWLPTQ